MNLERTAIANRRLQQRAPEVQCICHMAAIALPLVLQRVPIVWQKDRFSVRLISLSRG